MSYNLLVNDNRVREKFYLTVPRYHSRKKRSPSLLNATEEEDEEGEETLYWSRKRNDAHRN